MNLLTSMDTRAAENMPKSLDAEKSILGAILLDDRIVWDATSVLSSEDFFLDGHRRIFRAMSELADTKRIDIITLTDELGRRGDLDGSGGIAYIASLTDGVPRRPSIDHYCEMVRETARARRTMVSFYNATCRLAQGERTDEVLSDAHQQLIEQIYHSRAGRGCDLKTAVRDTLEKANELRNITTDFLGAPTGLTELDQLTTGFREKELIIIGGRPGTGKSQWMAQAVVEQTRYGWKPGVFSAELPRDQFLNRMACQIAVPRIPISDVRDPRVLSRQDFTRYCESLATISTWDLFMDDTPRIPVKQLCSIARMWISRGCNCIWVDFLQKLRADGRNPFEVVTNIANDLWELARTTGVPVVALSQLKRTSDPDEDPTMEDLRGSGDIEQNANLIVLLAKDKLCIPKNRSGEADISIPYTFDKKFGRFEYRSRPL